VHVHGTRVSDLYILSREMHVHAYASLEAKCTCWFWEAK
jgi:hypothetical protein